jgi:hypothetical protein
VSARYAADHDRRQLKRQNRSSKMLSYRFAFERRRAMTFSTLSHAGSMPFYGFVNGSRPNYHAWLIRLRRSAPARSSLQNVGPHDPTSDRY